MRSENVMSADITVSRLPRRKMRTLKHAENCSSMKQIGKRPIRRLPKQRNPQQKLPQKSTIQKKKRPLKPKQSACRNTMKIRRTETADTFRLEPTLKTLIKNHAIWHWQDFFISTPARTWILALLTQATQWQA